MELAHVRLAREDFAISFHISWMVCALFFFSSIFCIILTTHVVSLQVYAKFISHRHRIKLLTIVLRLWNDRYHFSMLNEIRNGTKSDKQQHHLLKPYHVSVHFECILYWLKFISKVRIRKENHFFPIIRRNEILFSN